MPEDLRSFLGQLEAAGQLVEIRRPVDPAVEVAPLMLELERRRKAGLFRQVGGTGFSMVSNVLCTREMVGLALRVDPAEVNFAWRERAGRRIEPLVVESAPVQEVVLTGKDADLTRLPLVTHAAKDAGPYVSAGMVFARDPESGRRNVSFNRIQLKEPQKAGLNALSTQQLASIFSRMEARGKNLPVAVVVGNHPCDMMAAATSLPAGDDEMALAGSLRGEPVPVVRCLTVDVEVPATAEVVLEGEILAGVREPEGPFGDFLQFYASENENLVFLLKAITHRKHPIWQSIHPGSREDVNLLGLSRETQILEAVLQNGARVVAVRLSPTILTAVVALEKQYEGEPTNVAMAAFGAYRWLKSCIVVDHDVDPGDMNDVWWAVASRARPNGGVQVIGNVGGFPLDKYGIHRSKCVIDATAPLGNWDEFERKRVPRDGELRLEDYL